jgi:putative hemolysin
MISEYLVYNIFILLFMGFSFFFSGVETAILSANPIRLKVFAEKGNKNAKRALWILDKMEDAINMVLIGNNIANISAASFIAFIATKEFYLNESFLFLIAIVQTIIFLILCEIFPKIVARSRAESFLMLCSYPIVFLMMILKPALGFAVLVTGKLRNMLNIKSSQTNYLKSRDEIGMLFKMGVNDGIIDKSHHGYIDEFLTFNQICANEVMTPLIDVISIERKQGTRMAIKLFDRTNFSRIPVYEERVDNIIGYLHYRDFLKNTNIKNIDEVLKKPHFIPLTKKIHSLFHEMQDNKIPVVFAVNEFGAVEGMVTKEDIAEEIVGEIQTRDHPSTDLIQKQSPRKYIVNGKIDIDFIKRKFGINLEKKSFETLAGFITYQLGKIPKKGDKLVYDKFTFIIEDATDRYVEKVLLILPAKKG